MAPYKIIVLNLIVAAGSIEAVSARYLVGNRFILAADDGGGDYSEEQPDEPPLEEEPPLYDEDEFHENNGSLIAAQFTRDPFDHRDRLEMIQTGELGLAGLRYHPTSFANDGTELYTEVYGEFCVFDSQLNKVDPSRYSNVKDVMAESSHCGEHRYTIYLDEVMDVLKNNENDEVKTLPVSGMLFHQGYSGAGLISNALTAFDSTLVVSEHTAIHSALSACDVIHNRYKSDDCSSVKQQKLLQDIISLLSRTTDKNVQHLFLKLESSSAAYLPTLHALYPSAKWTFSYRNAEEALSKSMQRKRSSTCMKAQRNPTTALAEKSAENNLDLEHLSHHEVCALHLSTLIEAAVREQGESGTGLLVSYDDILSSNVIIDEVLPYLGLKVNAQANDRITDILSVRSNSQRSHQVEQWDKSQEDGIEISDEVRNAVKMFMTDLNHR